MMQLDPETLEEIRAILGRDCVVEVTVTFYDNSDDAREPIDIGATALFDERTPSAEVREELGAMLDSLRDVFGTLTSS
ncbi:MAG: hypothetical protein EB084_23805 [Proteobacteria bacterium]|nr:hypothetical protein [Pseudomonadota bacterium]